MPVDRTVTLKEVKASSIVSRFLEFNFGLGSLPDGSIRCFRGQSNIGWRPQPSIFRDMKPNAESGVINELLLDAHSEFLQDKSMFSKLVRAQHYRLPTRLLDVTLNPLAALYFACEDRNEMHSDGCVLIFDFNESRVKFPDSDTVSLIANLANLKDTERAALTTAANVGKWTPKLAEEFNKRDEMDRLFQFVRAEKPYFRSEAEPLDLKRYFFVHATRNNRRIVAQSGAFIIAGLLRYLGLEKSGGAKSQKIRIPAGEKSNILRHLDALNFNEKTMFPEMEFASSYIKGRWKKSATS